MATITNSALVQTVYTEKGNKYEKTNAGKKAGTVAGAVAGGACLAPTANSMAAKSKEILLNKLTSVSYKFNKFGKMTADTFTFSGIKKPAKTVAEKLVTSKCGRLAVVAGVLAGAILAGRALGSLVDAAVNKFKAHKADKAAEQKEAIIKEYEASKTEE